MPKRSAAEIRDEIDNALDGVKGLSALGLWTRMRRWIETSSHDGHLYIGGLAGTLERVAEHVGRSPAQLSQLMKPLVKRGVLSINAHGTIVSDPLAELRKEQRRQALKSAAYRVKHKSGVTSPLIGGDAGGDAGVTGTPPLSLSHTLSLTSPPPEKIPIAAQSGRQPRSRKPTEPMPGHQRSVDAWMAAWSTSHHGGRYPFDGRDGKAVNTILERFGARTNVDLAVSRFGKLIATYLGTEPPAQMYRGHPLYRVAENMPEWIDRTGRAEKGIVANGNHKPAAAERGEYVGPTGGGIKRLPSQQKREAATN